MACVWLALNMYNNVYNYAQTTTFKKDAFILLQNFSQLLHFQITKHPTGDNFSIYTIYVVSYVLLSFNKPIKIALHLKWSIYQQGCALTKV